MQQQLGPERTRRRVGLGLGGIAVSLGVVAAVHLSGPVEGRGSPYDAGSAGAAEAVIGLVLLAAAVVLWRGGSRARSAGLWATGFAVAGFCLGLVFTVAGGPWADVAYHLVVLPLLVATFLTLRGTRG